MRIVNRIKSTPCSLPGAGLAGLGIRGFKPTLRRAPERLAELLTPEGTPPPPNTLAELRRAMARLRFVIGQIREIEAARLERLEQHPNKAPTRWSGGWHSSSALVSRQRTCWYTRACRVTCATAQPWRVMPD